MSRLNMSAQARPQFAQMHYVTYEQLLIIKNLVEKFEIVESHQ